MPPVDCFEQADSDTKLSTVEILDMCKAVILNKVSLPNCAPSSPSSVV